MTEPGARFLDTGQYTAEGIRRYERIYGRGFISPGGVATAREFIAMLDLKPGARVLDAGCGIGGAAFLMAKEHGAVVEGIDLSANMIDRAAGRCRSLGLQSQVTFRHGDLLALDAENHFDAVYSRDVILHVGDKRKLFAVFRRALKAGGRLLVTDYCRGDGPASEAFERYVRERAYHLITIEEYERVLRSAGFTGVRALDLTHRFIEIHAGELARMEQSGDAAGELSELSAGWREKIERASGGEQRWGLFLASKPD